ncbi:MAG: CcdB family protein [Rubrivivax sp.]
MEGLPRRLAQTMIIDGEAFYLAAQQCAPLPANLLHRPVASVADQRAAVIDALDAVISGV